MNLRDSTEPDDLSTMDKEDLLERTELITDISFEIIDVPIASKKQTHVFRKGFLTYKGDVVACNLTEKSLFIQYNSRNMEICLVNVFSVQPIKNGFYMYTFEKEKKYRYQFNTQDMKSANEWIWSIHANTFGLTKEIRKRKILVVINPYSGTKKAEEVFVKYVKPILDVAHVSYTIYKSKSRGDITTMIKRLDVNLYDEFTCVGGDGTLHEVIQGIVGRNLDWRLMIQKPISIVPAGSGNALATELGLKNPEMAAFVIARGFYRPLDITTMIVKGQRIWCATSATWGIVHDIDEDTETEFMRNLGSFRYDLSAFKKIFDHKEYNGNIDFVEETEKVPDMRRYNIYENPVEKMTFEGKLMDGPPCHLLEKYFYNEYMEILKKKYMPQQPHKDVKSIEREIVLFCAMNIKYLTNQYQIGPRAHTSDGCMDLIIITKEMGSWQMLYSFMTDFASGDFIKRKEVEYYKVNAFCLKPKKGGIAIDGELVGTPSVILGQVHKGLLKVLTL